MSASGACRGDFMLFLVVHLCIGLPIDDHGELVGDTDGSSFGFGKAPSSAKAGHSSVVNARKRDAKKKGKELARGATR